MLHVVDKNRQWHIGADLRMKTSDDASVAIMEFSVTLCLCRTRVMWMGHENAIKFSRTHIKLLTIGLFRAYETPTPRL